MVFHIKEIINIRSLSVGLDGLDRISLLHWYLPTTFSFSVERKVVSGMVGKGFAERETPVTRAPRGDCSPVATWLGTYPTASATTDVYFLKVTSGMSRPLWEEDTIPL